MIKAHIKLSAQRALLCAQTNAYLQKNRAGAKALTQKVGRNAKLTFLPIFMELFLAEIGLCRVAVEHHHAGNGDELCIHHGSIFLDTPSVGRNAVGVSACDGSAVGVGSSVNCAAHVLGSRAVEVYDVTTLIVHGDIFACEGEGFQGVALGIGNYKTYVFCCNVGRKSNFVLDADACTQIQTKI